MNTPKGFISDQFAELLLSDIFFEDFSKKQTDDEKYQFILNFIEISHEDFSKYMSIIGEMIEHYKRPYKLSEDELKFITAGKHHSIIPHSYILSKLVSQAGKYPDVFFSYLQIENI